MQILIAKRYVFDVMNDVTRTILANSDNELIDKISSDKKDTNTAVTYVNGKIVLTDDLDNAIIKNFKVCGSKSVFLDEIDSGYDEYDYLRNNVNIPDVEN